MLVLVALYVFSSFQDGTYRQRLLHAAHQRGEYSAIGAFVHYRSRLGIVPEAEPEVALEDQMINVQDLMTAITAAIEDVTGEQVESSIEDAPVDSDVEMDAAEDEFAPEGDEVVADMEMDDEMLEETGAEETGASKDDDSKTHPGNDYVKKESTEAIVTEWDSLEDLRKQGQNLVNSCQRKAVSESGLRNVSLDGNCSDDALAKFLNTDKLADNQIALLFWRKLEGDERYVQVRTIYQLLDMTDQLLSLKEHLYMTVADGGMRAAVENETIDDDGNIDDGVPTIHIRRNKFIQVPTRHLFENRAGIATGNRCCGSNMDF